MRNLVPEHDVPDVQLQSSSGVEPTPSPDPVVVGAGSAAPSAGPAPNSGLRVRLFEAEDREPGRKLLRQHHANTVFHNQTFSDWKYDHHVSHVLQRPPRMVGISALFNGQLVGIAWGQADGYMLSDGPLFVTVQLIAVELEAISPVRRAKTFLALISAIRQWAQSQGASHSFVHVTTGSNLAPTDRLMKAAGAKFIGGAYVV